MCTIRCSVSSCQLIYRLGSPKLGKLKILHHCWTANREVGCLYACHQARRVFRDFCLCNFVTPLVSLGQPSSAITSRHTEQQLTVKHTCDDKITFNKRNVDDAIALRCWRKPCSCTGESLIDRSAQSINSRTSSGKCSPRLSQSNIDFLREK